MDQILIVEDDDSINQLLYEAMGKEGYCCEQAFSGTEAKRLLMQEEYVLILLDLMLPGISGEKLLTDIRKTSQAPVIVLTAKDQIEEKVDVLKSGADDYITKPFDIKEVLARIEVQLRHRNKELPKQVLTYRNMILDRNTFQVTVNQTVLPKITKQEFSILELLLKHPEKVYSKEEIFEYAWEEMFMGETKTLDVHISNIRKKIKKVTDEEYIETIWGIGYRLQN